MLDNTQGIVIEQLAHPGGQVWFEEERPAYAPSSYPHPRSYVLPLEMTSQDISEVRQSYVEAAQVVYRSGLHGVEIKADQGKLIHQFLSSELNRRRDEYGGSISNRSRFLREILLEIRECTSPEFVIGVRISGQVTPPTPSDFGVLQMELGLEESINIAKMLSHLGVIDYISVSGETNSTVWGYWQNHGDESVPLRTFERIAGKLKANSELPILLAGRFLTLDDADHAIQNGYCDMVGMARALIADAELLSSELSSKTTRLPPARPCVSCNLTCVGRTWYGNSVACIYDPLSGREFEVSRRKTSANMKHFAVVGAGPAGLEFARTSATLGARVTVFESSHVVGGQLNSWARLPNRGRMSGAIEYWRESLERSSLVSVVTGRLIDEEFDGGEFDAWVWAVGAEYVLPAFVDQTAVVSMTVGQALSVSDWHGKNVIIVDGDRYLDPLGVATFVASQGASISVVTPFDQIGVGLDPVSRAARLTDLRRYEAEYHTWCDLRFDQSDGRLLLFDQCSNTVRSLEADVVIWCTNPLPKRISKRTQPNVFSIGNASWPRGLEVITKEAFDLAYFLMR